MKNTEKCVVSAANGFLLTKKEVEQMLIAILVLSALSALGALSGAGALILICVSTYAEMRDEKKAEANRKAAAQKQNINGEN